MNGATAHTDFDGTTAGVEATHMDTHLEMARLMAVAGHDLKQPLQVAVMSIERAVTDGLQSHGAERLAAALQALQRLNCELDDLVVLSQIKGNLGPQPQPVLLSDVLAQVERDWRLHADSYGVELSFRFAPVFVETDPRMLRTILRNLVGNAVKYCGAGGRIVVGPRMRGNSVIVEVRDDGGGIPPEHIDKIFNAFERGAWTGRGDGLGLGLHIVRQTAAALRHPVTVRSFEQAGSTFAIELPLFNHQDPQNAALRPGKAPCI